MHQLRTAGTAICSLDSSRCTVSQEGGGAAGGPARPGSYFCLAVHDLLSLLQSPMSRRLSRRHFEGGEADKVAEDFTRLESGAAKLPASHSNRLKCEVAGLTNDSLRFWLREG